MDAEQRALRAEHMLLEAQAEAAATAKAAAQQAAHTERQAAAAAAEAAQLITQAHAKVQLELARYVDCCKHMDAVNNFLTAK